MGHRRDGGWTYAAASARVVQALGLCLLATLASSATLPDTDLSHFNEEFHTRGGSIQIPEFEVEGEQKQITVEPGDTNRKGCGRPQKVAFASLSPQFIWRQWFFLQELVSYHCNIGYTVSGFSYSIRCVEGGWTKHKFSCVLVTCKVLVEPENGFISVATEPVYGSVASYMCADGYSLVGPQLRRCMQDGIWSDIDPVCEALSCPQPPDVANSAVVQMAQGTFSLGDSVMYACRDGFSISGEAHITCLESGIWSKPPTCIGLCPAPPDIAGATLVWGANDDGRYWVGSSLRYECRASRKGAVSEPPSESLRCLHNAKGDGAWWSPATLFCAKDCGNPGSPRHGRLEGSSFTEGDSATFVCDIGYKIGGKDHINTTCDSDGRWSRPLQDCELVNCGEPVMENGVCTGSAFTYNAQVNCSCDVGFIRHGRTGHRLCQENGLWTMASPCTLLSCGSPQPILNGRWTGNLTYGQVITYSCNEGYQMVESTSIVVCQANGLWLGRPPTCEPKTCPALSAPRDGFIENDEVTVGTVVIFGCNKGYKLAGKPTTECQPSLTWSSSIPSCQMVTCRAAPLEHGRVNVTAVTPFGSAAAYDCDLGFVLVGQRVRVCLDTGEWSGSNPHCHRIKCKTPLELQHGEVVVDRENLNRVIYVCHEGLVLEGPNVRMCTDAGTWSGTEPKCREVPSNECGPPPQIANAELHLKLGSILSFRVGTVLRYRCSTGHAVTSNSSYTISCTVHEHGVAWSTPRLTCLPKVCSYPGEIDNGYLTGARFTFGSKVTYYCNKGYTISERHTTRECMADGTWSFTLPVCQPAKCEWPRPQPGMVIDRPSRAEYDGVISHSCEAKLQLVGSATRTCQADGKWSGEEPWCKERICEKLPGIVNGKLLLDPDDPTLVKYVCDKGLVLQGPSVRVCTNAGTWSGSEPMCRRALREECGAPPNVENAELPADDAERSSYEVDTVLRYRCKLGYVMSQGAFHTIKCTVNHDVAGWSAHRFTCTGIKCEAPPELQHGEWVADRENPNQVIYVCHEGLVLEGPNVRMCTDAGTWSGMEPKCRAPPSGECGTPPPVPNAELPPGLLSVPRFRVGTVLRYRCSHGHTVSPDSSYTISCVGSQDSASWTTHRLTCTPKQCRHPGTIENGYFTGSNFTFGSKVKYSCNEGYIISERHTTRECMADGTWSFTLPVCQPVLCELPTKRPSLVVEAPTKLEFDSVIIYSCNKGQVLLGSTERVCQADGTWSGVEPECRGDSSKGLQLEQQHLT
ncbi:sushi, von Willebrand factor type A, EGF and pentraxin domain-containing protein 1-like isoform X3 [Petromyzon marinus]|uniref:sushi, von Willebrand factor type A, EGF and pentraxin domain-containing protein 1-like isoform X3 n=1 Tax=Petromyzon marinus TaxID=7757 RepID=UPI003F6FD446